MEGLLSTKPTLSSFRTSLATPGLLIMSCILTSIYTLWHCLKLKYVIWTTFPLRFIYLATLDNNGYTESPDIWVYFTLGQRSFLIYHPLYRKTPEATSSDGIWKFWSKHTVQSQIELEDCFHLHKLTKLVEWEEINKSKGNNLVSHKKNPAYGRQSISRPMRIVAPIP